MAASVPLPLPVAPEQRDYGRYGAFLAGLVFALGAASEFVNHGLNGQGLALGILGVVVTCAGTLMLGMRQLRSERRLQQELRAFIATHPTRRY